MPNENSKQKKLDELKSYFERTNYLFVCHFNLDRSDFFVFFEGTTAAGITLNDEKFGMLYRNHIYIIRLTYDNNTLIFQELEVRNHG